MSLFNGDASEFYALADDFAKIGAGAVVPVREAMLKGGETLRDQWKANVAAVMQSPSHIPAFAATVEARPTLGMSQIGVEVGPFAGGQGNLGGILEHGGGQSPAYLFGLHALDETEQKVQADFTAATAVLFK